MTGLYIHIPFCPQHCPYCAFAVVTGHRHLYERYVAAVCRELDMWELNHLGPFHTVYLGGGTPSILTPKQLAQILDTVTSLAGIAEHAEVTLEANPTTLEASKFVDLRQVGFNRLSLGVQSFSDADLQVLGRFHDASTCDDAYEQARRAGFDNISLDLMFSVPGAPGPHWMRTLEHALDLAPEHISTYSLTIEEGTRFAQRHQQGRLIPVSEEQDEWCYAWTMDRLEGAGYKQYEVSNFARPEYRSRHNWGYWTGEPYVGVGMSAHAYVDGQRQWNISQIEPYLARVEADLSPCEGRERLEGWEKRQEEIWLRLRTCDGIQLVAQECEALERSGRFKAMQEEGWLRLDRRQLTLTRRGRLLADTVGLEITGLIESDCT